MRLDIVQKEHEIRQWIEENLSKAEMSKRLRCKQATLESYLNKFGISYAGNQGSKGKLSHRKKSLQEYLQSTHITNGRIKAKLLEEGLKERKCEMCNNKEWNEKPIPLVLDHIDGNRFNIDLKNIRLICPNCDAQTITYRGKNIGKYT